MKTCIVLGEGRAATEFFEEIESGRLKASFIRYSHTDGKSASSPNCIGVCSPKDFESFKAIIRSHNVTRLCFVGAPPLRNVIQDMLSEPRTAVYLRKASKDLGFSWKLPNVLQLAVRLFCEENKVNIIHPRVLRPELVWGPGEAIGSVLECDPIRDLQAARNAARKQYELDPLFVAQAYIVENGNVREVYSRKTDQLIQNTARSSGEYDNSRSVLVKVGVGDVTGLDAPVVGIDTVRKCIAAGLRGVVIEAGKVSVYQKDEIRTEISPTSFFVTSV